MFDSTRSVNSQSLKVFRNVLPKTSCFQLISVEIHVKIFTRESRMAAAMNQAELENYEALHQRVETGITNAREEIEATKVQIRNTQTLFTTMAQYNPGFR